MIKEYLIADIIDKLKNELALGYKHITPGSLIRLLELDDFIDNMIDEMIKAG